MRGPYGCFDATKATGKQVWLAGGIGITPFLSQFRDLEADDSRDIWLVYAVRDESQAPYIDELRQIAMDGSLKLPQRLLGTILDNRKAGRAAPLLTLSVAGWMRYVGGIDDRGDIIDVRDPLAKDLRSICDASRTPSETVGGLLEVARIFEADLREDAIFRNDLICAYEALLRLGARASVEAALSG